MHSRMARLPSLRTTRKCSPPALLGVLRDGRVWMKDEEWGLRRSEKKDIQWHSKDMHRDITPQTLAKINRVCERGRILRGNFSLQASIFEKNPVSFQGGVQVPLIFAATGEGWPCFYRGHRHSRLERCDATGPAGIKWEPFSCGMWRMDGKV